MVVEERKRRRLQEALMNSIGTDATETLFDDFLPPGGWANVATKQDIELLRVETNGRFDRLEGRIDRLEGRIDGLEGRIDGLVGRIDALETRFAGNIDGLAGNIDGLDGRIGMLETRIAGNIDAFRAEMHQALRQQFYAFAMLVIALAGLFIGLTAAHVTG